MIHLIHLKVPDLDFVFLLFMDPGGLSRLHSLYVCMYVRVYFSFDMIGVYACKKNIFSYNLFMDYACFFPFFFSFLYALCFSFGQMRK